MQFVPLSAAATLPPLSPGVIHVWRFWLDNRRDQHALWSHLIPDERRRAEAFFQPVHQQRFAAARGMLRRLIAGYTGIPAGEVVFRTGAFGKPELALAENHLAHSRARLCFNLSHSDDLAVAAFALSGRLGLDVERVRTLPDARSIAQRQFAPAEAAWLESAPPEAQAEVFFRIWTRKEAVLKAVGAGLSIDLRGFNVVPVRGRGEVLPLALGPGLPADAWRWHEWSAAPGFLSCLVTDDDVSEVGAWEASDA